MTPVYPFLAIDVPASLAGVAADELFSLGAEGVEQRDTSTLVRGAHSSHAAFDPGAHVGVPTDDVAAANDEVVTLVAAFPTREAAEEAAAAFDAEMNPRIEEVHGDEWRDAWKAHFEPFRLSPHVVIRPPWREVPTAMIGEVAGTRVVELEPGRAFGTGLHASTMLVARALDARRDALAGAEVLDVGCGSGVLSLVALSLGAARARAIDVDEDAARVTRENAARNGMAERVEADATPVEKIAKRYAWVLANIQAEVLVPLAEAIAATVAEGGVLMLSGVLVEQGERVRAAYPAFGLEEATQEGEWVGLVLRRT